MEFYLVVLIFITCMIVLALLIYYCQEYRINAKYSFTENQRDISAIALAIAAPAFNTSRYQPTDYQSPGIVPFMLTPPQSQPPAPGFVINGTQSEKPTASPYPTKLPPSPQGYVRPSLMPDDEMSDSGSSSSSKIYFNPNTTAYYIAKRMSVTANADVIAKRKSLQAVIPAQTAAYILAQRMKEIQKQNENVNHTSISENINKSDRGNSQESCSIEMRNRRSVSPYIPASVVAFHLRNKDSRSGSPYTPLRNNSPTFLEENERSRNKEIESNNSRNNSNSSIPVAPKRLKKQASIKQEENECSEMKELAPPKRNENICYPKQNPVFMKKGNEDHIPFVPTEASYRSPSPAPLHTVEEEE